MTIARIYGFMWLLAAVFTFSLYVTNTFTTTNTLLWGFFVHALAGVGILAIYPAVLKEQVTGTGQRS